MLKSKKTTAIKKLITTNDSCMLLELYSLKNKRMFKNSTLKYCRNSKVDSQVNETYVTEFCENMTISLNLELLHVVRI